MTEMHPLDRATRLEWAGAGRAHGHTDPAYQNMTGPFGGVTAATLLRAVMEHSGRRGSPFALTVNFCGPITEGAFEIAVRLVHDGRSVQHWTMELLQGGVTAATASAITGSERETFAHQALQPPKAPPFETVPVMDTSRRPGWVSRYEMRPFEGTSAFDGPEDAPLGSARTGVWIRDRPGRALDHLALASLSDAFIVRLFHLRGRVSPAGTVSITTYFYATEAELAAQETNPLIGTADARVFRHGFHDQIAELWTADGALLAVSTQTVWFKG